jgi:hypothetical protein
MTQESPPPEPSPEKPPFSEQIADLVLKVLKPGGVTCGGIGAFWFLFADSDVPKAIASALIGVGLSYAAKLLEPIHQGNQRRLVSAGKAIDAGFDAITGSVIAAASGFENKYLLCQASDCETVRSDGIRQHEGLFTPLLKEVFVPLALDTNANLPGYKALPGEEFTREEQNIWQFLAKVRTLPPFRQMIILAWGGSGKTTLLKHIAYRYGIKEPLHSAPQFIPVLLILRKYRDMLAQDKPLGLPELITHHHIPSLPGAADLQIPAHWAKEMLKRGNAIVMLDGFDEVPKDKRPAVSRWINEQMRQYSKSVFIVTSRPKAYRDQDVTDRLDLSTPLWIKDFGVKQRQDFVEQWYLCQERYASGGRDTPDVRKAANQAATRLLAEIEARPELKALAKNPLLLNMVVAFHRRCPGADLPKRRVELYQEICRLQLRDRPKARTLETLLTQCDAQTILQQVALAMMQNRMERIPRTSLLKGLTKLLKQQGEEIPASDFLDQVADISELLIQQEDEYEFAHLSFQEYLAATQIAQTKQESLLHSKLGDDWWKPTIRLYAAQVNPTTLIREAMRQGEIDLAYACLQETTKRLDPTLQAELQTLQQTITTSRYQQLETYLSTGQWQAADQETYRLMITTVGKEEGQYFDREDLLNFPCEELRTIDRLWVKYSQGKFGFSVQKQIYLECGGQPDGNYPGDKIWKEFGDRVGWRVKGEWISYSDITFDTKAPSGYLPCSVIRGVVMVGIVGVGGGGATLLSHRDL